jgi:hypothetical protein
MPLSTLVARRHEAPIPRVVLAHLATRSELEIASWNGDGLVCFQQQPKDQKPDDADRKEREPGLFFAFAFHTESLAEVQRFRNVPSLRRGSDRRRPFFFELPFFFVLKVTHLPFALKRRITPSRIAPVRV